MPRDSLNASHMEEKERRVAPSCSQSASKETASIPSPSTHSASGQESDINRDLEGDKLDVCSESFDPLLALYSATVPLPFPNIKCFNNVAEYEGFLKGGRGRAKPENVEKKRRKAMKGVADPERIERLKKLMVHNPVQADGETSGTTRRKKQKAHKNVLTRMPLCKGSPLGELHRSVEERIRVKVHIRTFKGLRGVCSGFVVAFDKFWNMAMVDVDETYREPLLGEAFYHEKALTITRLFEKLQLQECTESNEHPGKHKAKGKSTIPQQETSAAALTSAPCDLASRGTCGHSETKGNRTDPRLPAETVKVTEDEGRAHVKACGSETSQSAQGKSAKPYGKIHSRHINQLFIRGENVLLVNLQPL